MAALFLSAGVARAQDNAGGTLGVSNDPLHTGSLDSKDSEGTVTGDLYKKLPPDIQELLVEEAQHVYEYCESREFFASLYDCRCVASKVMDKRILNPAMEADVIAMGDNVADECPNEPAFAAYSYTECMTTYAQLMKYGEEDFCTCYANSIAKKFKAAPDGYIPYLNRLGSSALTECDATGMPSPYHPDR